LVRRQACRHEEGAVSFFLTDEVGGSGWEVATSEGRTEKYYVALPPDIGAAITSTLVFPDAPSEHRGQPLTDKSVATLGQLYLDYLDELISEAAALLGGG
jgi:hypothetical protein